MKKAPEHFVPGYRFPPEPVITIAGLYLKTGQI